MTNYSPFDKEIADLDEQELQKLVDNAISEGWYIEYKAAIPIRSKKIDSSKIVKAISAFANTKGGWLFFGIESNDKNIATNLCGIELDNYDNLIDQISQIISGNIAPKPIYHFKTVPLHSDKIVLVVKIDESPIPPYITSKGIIYQRENNESNPIRDRYIIEKLSEKADAYYQAIERFCQIDYGQTSGQADSDQSYLELYLFPLPYNEFQFKNFFKSEFFKQVAASFYKNTDFVFENKDGSDIRIPLNLGFNSIYSSQNSLIIRPLREDNLIYKSTTAELFINGGFKFLIPLLEFDINHVPKHYANSNMVEYLKDVYSPYEMVDEIDNFMSFDAISKPKKVKKRKITDFVTNIKMIDGVELIYTLLVIIDKYRAVLENSEFDTKIKIGYRARLTDTWRKFIFFDNADYLKKIKLYNLPIAPKREVEVPRFIKGNYYNMEIEKQNSFMKIARTILDAIGLPDSSTIQFSDIINDGLKKFNNKAK